MFPMFTNGFGINKDNVNLNNGEMTKGIEDIIHSVLELTRGILKTKGHNIPFVMSEGSGED